MNKKDNTKKNISAVTPKLKTELKSKPFDTIASRDVSDLDVLWNKHIDSMLTQEFASIEAAVDEISTRVLCETYSTSQVSEQEKNDFMKVILDNEVIRENLIKILKIRK